MPRTLQRPCQPATVPPADLPRSVHQAKCYSVCCTLIQLLAGSSFKPLFIPTFDRSVCFSHITFSGRYLLRLSTNAKNPPKSLPFFQRRVHSDPPLYPLIKPRSPPTSSSARNHASIASAELRTAEPSPVPYSNRPLAVSTPPLIGRFCQVAPDLVAIANGLTSVFDLINPSEQCLVVCTRQQSERDRRDLYDGFPPPLQPLVAFLLVSTPLGFISSQLTSLVSSVFHLSKAPFRSSVLYDGN
ncbi:hypothetical protein PGTUg99_033561 [Puccinia graminis f. sp. tritici]|uniref:Uncharacterized protein n=1 Tax=Puccinia graminis f. sp. tritici TaxID=56615 RepID=A0A5B0RXR1_PUCGR|nr:hypothetical protein PGTUg99_033561 [Puccinia graminis f. sp. tritici]